MSNNTFFRPFANLSTTDLDQAAADYALFFSTVAQKNPTDINTDEKATFMLAIGMTRFAAMQACRKNSANLAVDFTKRGG